MEEKVKHVDNNNSSDVAADAGRITINCYTDPLCCWSWASHPHWNKLKQDYPDAIRWNYIMGGMIPDWKSYNDPMNAVSKPLQMGPVWMHAAQITNIPIHYSIWHEDPPSSSYPACIAVKCASSQSALAGELYFYAVQQALMVEGQNIARTEVLFKVAERVTAEHPTDFDLTLFQDAWTNEQGLRAFREDIKQARYHKIGRFPALTITDTTGKGIIIVGYRPYEALVQAFMQVC